MSGLLLIVNYMIGEKFIIHLPLNLWEMFVAEVKVIRELYYMIREKMQTHLLLNHLFLLHYMFREKFMTWFFLPHLLLSHFYLILRKMDTWLTLWPLLEYRNMICNVFLQMAGNFDETCVVLIMDGPPPVQGHPGKPAHGGPPPVQDRSDEPAPELEPPRDDPVPDRDDPAGASASDLDDSLHEVDTGILGDLVGAHVDGEWVSANYPLEWYAEGGELPWLSFNELLEMATEAYKNFRAEQRALLTRSLAPAGWKQKSEYHIYLLFGVLLFVVFLGCYAPWDDTARSFGKLYDTDWGDLCSSSSAATDGFYKHGVWQPRARTEEERRWAAGGQGKVRQDKRSARMKAWASGEWVPSWLRKFREEKEERERLRREQAATEQRLDEEQDQEADEGDETELWQHRLARDGEDEPWEDVVSFMERPGMSGQEYVDLINGGIPSHLARRAEARWALGRWLVTSQVGAAAQDRAEEPIVARARDDRHYPLRREPDDRALRCELLLQWTDEITNVMAAVYAHGANVAHPGELRDIPWPLTVEDLGENNLQLRSGNSNNFRAQTGQAPGADEMKDELVVMRRRGEDVSHAANDTVDSGHGVGTFDGPPSFLGPMSLEALDTDEDRHFDLTGEEQSFAASAFLIEQAVRSTMYELTSGSAREAEHAAWDSGDDTILASSVEKMCEVWKNAGVPVHKYHAHKMHHKELIACPYMMKVMNQVMEHGGGEDSSEYEAEDEDESTCGCR
eukprot:s863_g10.t1